MSHCLPARPPACLSARPPARLHACPPARLIPRDRNQAAPVPIATSLCYRCSSWQRARAAVVPASWDRCMPSRTKGVDRGRNRVSAGSTAVGCDFISVGLTPEQAHRAAMLGCEERGHMALRDTTTTGVSHSHCRLCRCRCMMCRNTGGACASWSKDTTQPTWIQVEFWLSYAAAPQQDWLPEQDWLPGACFHYPPPAHPSQPAGQACRRLAMVPPMPPHACSPTPYPPPAHNLPRGAGHPTVGELRSCTTAERDGTSESALAVPTPCQSTGVQGRAARRARRHLGQAGWWASGWRRTWPHL